MWPTVKCLRYGYQQYQLDAGLSCSFFTKLEFILKNVSIHLKMDMMDMMDMSFSRMTWKNLIIGFWCVNCNISLRHGPSVRKKSRQVSVSMLVSGHNRDHLHQQDRHQEHRLYLWVVSRERGGLFHLRIRHIMRTGMRCKITKLLRYCDFVCY